MITARIVHRFSDREELARNAAAAFVSVGREALDARGRLLVALSGGSTPADLYQSLTNPEYRRQLDWSRAEFFWGDERAVSPDDQESNYRMACDALLGPLNIPPEHIHRIEAERGDPEAAAQEYAAAIAGCFDVSVTDLPPAFDLILLGLGEDGHTASLFPHTRALRVTNRWVVANQVPQLSTTRITMTFPLINRARAVFFLVAGDAKASALARVLHGPYDAMSFPSQAVHPDNGRLECFIDHAAAAQLTTQAHD